MTFPIFRYQQLRRADAGQFATKPSTKVANDWYTQCTGFEGSFETGLACLLAVSVQQSGDAKGAKKGESPLFGQGKSKRGILCEGNIRPEGVS